MPAKAQHLGNRGKNFLKRVKKVVEQLSPWKKQRITEENKENARIQKYCTRNQHVSTQGKALTAPSNVSADCPAITEDVFMTPYSHVKIPIYNPYGSFSCHPDVPTGPSEQFYHEYSLLPPPKCRTTVEEVPNEDDVSHLAAQSSISVNSLDSRDSEHLDVHTEETAAFEKAAASDPAAQDAYANVYDVFIVLGKLRAAPSIPSTTAAVKDLMVALRRESRGVSGGYKDPKHDPFSKTFSHWGASALQAAVGWAREHIALYSRCALLLVNPYGDRKESMLADEDLAADINWYLQEIGKDITAEKLVLYLGRPDVMEKHGITKSITVWTARRYLSLLGYQYMMLQKGQYCDGHEQPDVVYSLPEYGLHLLGKRVITWHHDECVFYAHDRKRKNRYKKGTSKLHQKGDGHSLMVADFVSVDFGWSPTSRDGTMGGAPLLEAWEGPQGVYPEFEHHLVYDNATTHCKCPDGSLSACSMLKKPSKPDTNFGVQVNACDANGRPVYTTARKLKKIKINMTGAEFNGQSQSLYFPGQHLMEGLFKGMAIILEEHGLVAEFGNRSSKFADAYANGLNRRQAAWAAHKYCGHHVIPESTLEELEAAGID
ncbi:hypothetical protein DFH08DRAFT_806310 [Mycena albidolilacea]|uniref:Uncharacterized protein n=1 Tax=Mycena albidolilacea TaxID=1033008 RepID=A0AAD7EWA8_9AGAR|nr:hypothetical protein DFH08DRAFT_806310 [Mycena albidolilacea]